MSTTAPHRECERGDPDLWFTPAAWAIRAAKLKCNDCYFKEQCLDECIEFEDMSGTTRHGIFGGTTPAERNKLRAKRDDKRGAVA